MGQIFSPYSNPPRKVGSKSIPPQIKKKILGHPSQIISKLELFLLAMLNVKIPILSVLVSNASNLVGTYIFLSHCCILEIGTYR